MWFRSAKAVLQAHIEVVGRLIISRRERLPVIDAKITAMLIAQRFQAPPDHRSVGTGCYDDVHIHDRFGCHSGDGGTAYMLDRDGRIAQGRPDLLSKPLEHLRPIPIVVDHFNGCDSRWFGHSSMINAMQGNEVAQFPGEMGLTCW
jgi:hypothetical protein